MAISSRRFHDCLPLMATASLFLLASVFLLTLVHDHVPMPYMDEEFHVRQATKYCAGNFVQWDPKITTPPGLYILSVGLIGPLSSVISTLNCSVLGLRSINVIFSLGNLYLFYAITRKLNTTTDQRLCPWRCALTALNLATFPTLYFFTFLYYTDPGSVFLVFLAHLFQLNGNDWAAAAVGAASLFFRQTNIVWVAFFAAVALKGILEKSVPAKQLKRVDRSSVTYLKILIQVGLDAMLNRGGLKRHECGAYLCVGLGFAAFVWLNGGIVLGDRAAHQVAVHIPQLFYLAAFIWFFSLPATWPSFRKIPGLLMRTSNSAMTLTKVNLILVVTCVVALFVAFNTRAHPYLLADNRHYPFYIWRKFLGRHPAMKFIPIPIYLVGGFHALRLLCERRGVVWCLLYVLCVAANVVTQELLEFRYFIVPFLMFRLQVPLKQRTSSSAMGLLSLELLMNTAVNAVTLYVFLKRPFVWPDGDGLQRFMW